MKTSKGATIVGPTQKGLPKRPVKGRSMSTRGSKR